MWYRTCWMVIWSIIALWSYSIAAQQTQVTFSLVADYTWSLLWMDGTTTGAMWWSQERSAMTGTNMTLDTLSWVSYQLIRTLDDAIVMTGVTEGGISVLPLIFSGSGIYRYHARLLYQSQVIITNEVQFLIDQDTPHAIGPLVVESVQDHHTSQDSVRFRWSQAHDTHTDISHYTIEIYDDQQVLLYTLHMPQREVYIDRSLLPVGIYSVSLTATDIVWNVSLPYRQYFIVDQTSRRVTWPSGGEAQITWSADDDHPSHDQEHIPSIDTQDHTQEDTENTTNHQIENQPADQSWENDDQILVALSPQAQNTNSDESMTIISPTHESDENKHLWWNESIVTPLGGNTNQERLSHTVIDMRTSESSTPQIITASGEHTYHAAPPTHQETQIISSTTPMVDGWCRWIWMIIICETWVIWYILYTTLWSYYTKSSTKFDR